MEDLLVEPQGGGVTLLRINRPEARNALNMALRRALAEAFTHLGADPEVRCIVVTGDRKAFAAGADIKELAEAGSIEILQRQVHLLWRAIAACPKPVIAAVNGYAWGGGCELAMHADIVIAGEGASFCLPEIKVGIMPGAGGTQRLVRAVGKFQAMRMLMTGQPIPGREAFASGLASEVVADDQVLARALEMAATIATMPPLGILQIKEVVLAGQDASLETALMLERKAFQLLFSSQDQKEGMRAFIEKRAPQYQGK